MRVLRGVLGIVASLTVVGAGACVGDSSGSDAGPDATACTKVCNESCVSGTDPASGCGGPSCAPCPGSGEPHETAACQSGACATACDPGFGDCNESPGCETNTASDPMNCGACGHVCGTANTTAVGCGSAPPDAGADAATDAGTAAPGTCAFTCNGAYAHCGTDDSMGCETNIGTDPNNCGACGHSCGGGQCVGGYCQPVILAGNPTSPDGLWSIYGLTLIGTSLYGTDWEGAPPNNGLVFKVSTTPGNPLTWIVGGPSVDGGAGSQASATNITTNGTSLVYNVFHVGDPGAGAGIWGVNPDGTNNTLLVSGGTTGGGPACSLSTAYGYEVDGLTIDSGYIYWVRDTYGGCFPSTLSCRCQGIYRSDITGNNVQVFFASTYYTQPLADSGSLYMVDYSKQQVVVATSMSFSMSTPPVGLPNTQSSAPSFLRTDATYVYWLDVNAKRFYRAKKIAATASDDITPMAGMPSGALVNNFLVDPNANRIYFVSPPSSVTAPVPGQQIYMMPKDGSGPAVAIPGALVSGTYNDSLSTWTQDATAIYWATFGYGNPSSPYSTIYKLAKPL